MTSHSGSMNSQTSPQPVTTPASMVDAMESQWLFNNKRRAVRPTSMPGEYCAPLRILTAPEWPGVGTVETCVDVLPLVTIHGMPASEYPKYIKPLIAYTLAELACERPHMALAARSAEMIRITTLVVSVRAGAWAALGCAPMSSASVSNDAARWSDKMQCLVVRPAEIGDTTASWRQFLATFPGIPEETGAVAKVLTGVAPSLFLMGSALLLQAGEVYAMHYLEREVSAYLRSVLDSALATTLRLEARSTWEMLSAAAIGGYNASIMRQISADGAFATAATLRICPRDARALHTKLESLIANSPNSYKGIPIARHSRTTMPHTDDEVTVDGDDTASVADTEAGGYTTTMTGMPPSGCSTPRGHAPPSISPEQADEIRLAYQNIPRATAGLASAAMMPVGHESVVW